MNTFDLIITVVLFALSVIRLLAATWEDDDIKEIKHVCWAILFFAVIIGGSVVNI